MFTIHHLSKSYGLNPVLQNINFSLNKGERAALVGPNGCGKSTLLNIIAGKEQPDSGQVTYHPADLRIGYLHQGIEFAPGDTVGGYLNRFASNLQMTLAALEEVSQALTKQPNNPALATRYDQVLKDLAQAQEMEGARKSILEGFDLLEVPQETLRLKRSAAGKKCGWPWQGFCWKGRSCSCWTSRPTTWTWICAPGCRIGYTPIRAAFCWSPMTGHFWTQ